MYARLRAASLSLFAVGLAHSGLGEAFLVRHLGSAQGIRPLRDFVLVDYDGRGSEALAKRSLHACWHTPTLLGWGMALILNRYAQRAELGAEDRFVIRTMATALGLCGALWCAETRGKNPGWAALLGSGLLCWVAPDHVPAEAS